jgi:formylglycine-generating enzyme required for sulfatase activity
MAGNVSEWTANRVTGEDGTKHPVLRGANWMAGAGNSGANPTALRRDTDWKPLQSCETIGFRTASDNPE